ncbi:MAG: hypothetical protein AUJ19_02965 [Parcubacteria group bacterium CG1_02_58_44]|nr:MAG: hypothetical protein AUJ19_02965 [Parcubacteria group bacterium CG1_02_58_44]
MFQKQEAMTNREIGREPETIISASVKLEGDFVSQGNVLIEGEVVGSLKTEKDLRVGERARISADVTAASAIVAGEVRGNIDISDRLELEPTAKVFGDIRTADLVIASGAVVCGKITMGSEATSTAKAGKVGRKAAGKNEFSVDLDEDSSSVEASADRLIEGDSVDQEETNKKTVNAFFTK